MNNSLRHLGRGAILVEKKIGGEWIIAGGERLYDVSGGPFVQTLVNLGLPPAQLYNNVSAPGGVDTDVRKRLEKEILTRTGPNCGGMLWATSGSDAIESAIWAVKLFLESEVGTDNVTYIVREGAYHGNTELTRSLTTRGVSPKEYGKGVVKKIVIDGAEESSENVIKLIDQLKQEKPIILLLETVPTTGMLFWQGYEFYEEVLKACYEANIPVILDEVACGAYRHGWFSAFEWLRDYPPAAVVISKGLTCGTYPLSCALLRKDIVSSLGSMERLPAFTFGLNDPGAWLALEALHCFDNLIADGVFNQRKIIVAQALRNLEESGLYGEVESTESTLRLTITDQTQIEKLTGELKKENLMTYINTTLLNNRTVTFVFCCPPMNLEEGLCVSLFDKFCMAVMRARQ